jgi:hypothetical protein
MLTGGLTASKHERWAAFGHPVQAQPAEHGCKREPANEPKAVQTWQLVLATAG